MSSSVQQLAVDKDVRVGMDVGGTKVHIVDTRSSIVRRYNTADFPDMLTLLEAYCIELQAKPAVTILAMAGPRNDETGAIKLTNHPWPTFYPAQAAEQCGVRCITVNDMVATAAGVLQESSMDIQTLIAGTPAAHGTCLVVSLSTGIGVAAAMWSDHADRYVIMPTEGGYIGIQPKNDAELAYLQFLHTKYRHASAELALSGKYGIENLIEHIVEERHTPHLAQAINRARQEKTPVGAVLYEFASQGEDADAAVAAKILNHLGTMIGSVLRDYALAYKATGGIYLTGSVALALGDYFVKHTEFIERFVREGAEHDVWIQHIPIHLVTNPNIAVMGALELAKEEALQL